MRFPKANIIRDKKWLQYVRKERTCVITGSTDPDPAHIRFGLGGGMGMKPPDNLVLPLSHELHELQHRIGEMAFWCKYLPENPSFLMFCVKAGAEKIYQGWKDGK